MVRNGTLLFTCLLCLTSFAFAGEAGSSDSAAPCDVRDTPKGNILNPQDYLSDTCKITVDGIDMPLVTGGEPVQPVTQTGELQEPADIGTTENEQPGTE